MLKTTLLAAFAATAVAAFAQDDMMTVPDAKSSKPKELASFVSKDAYMKTASPDAYVISMFLSGLPGNYETALLRGLVRLANEAQDLKTKNQSAANMMAPMGDAMPPMMDSGFRQGQRSERSFEQVAMDPLARLSYSDVIKMLEISQDETDRGLIDTLFAPQPFTKDPLMTPYHERELDAISRYIKGLAMSTQPVRLKYTSLAPRNYPGLPADWASKPWPAGS